MTDPAWRKTHADAIRTLRQQVADLTVRLDALTGGTLLPEFRMPEHCVMCGEAREKGRKTLTCAGCSARRNQIITEHLDRTPILRDTCCACGEKFSRSARFLCTKCSAAFKIWKATT
jgi:hypothetical protein